MFTSQSHSWHSRFGLRWTNSCPKKFWGWILCWIVWISPW